ncbi:MAG: tail fiber domain-containing protein, partial [Bacteroidetes bacterium]|nr:tail fiber domain-containing protein [Bacteroidota bacterium]
STSTLERMRIDNLGNVGIGTTTPSEKVEVTGTVYVNNENSGVIVDAGGHHRVGLMKYYGTEAAFTHGNTVPLRWGQVNQASITGGTFTEQMRIDNNGNLCVGCILPTHKLEVFGSSRFYGGNVGMGTNAPPAYQLDVTGDIHNTGVMAVGATPTAGYALTINGSAIALGGGSVWQPSDQQFKINVDSLQGALSIIKQLKTKTYYFDTTNIYGLNFGHEKQHGLFAQQLEQVLPELVKTTTKVADYDTLGNIVHPAVTFKAVNYTGLIPILIKGIQELQEKNDGLQTELTKQDSVNTSQQNQINLIQNQLVTNSTVFQEQLNQLMSTINDCCNRPQESSTNNSQTKSINTPESGTTQIEVELNNSQIIVLEQNSPNPYAERTSINYYLPDNTGKAEILFYNTQGRLIKSVELINKGKGTLNVFAGDLSSGIYTYTLVVDGKAIETKKMVKQ